VSPDPKTRPLLALARASTLAVALAALLCGARAIRRSAVQFDHPVRKVLIPEFREQLRRFEERVPAGPVVLHLSSAPEYWYSRLWQRVLYPRNETIVLQQPLTAQRVQELRAKYGARFAISQGNPPWDPGFLWKVDLGPLPGSPGVTWCGELGP